MRRERVSNIAKAPVYAFIVNDSVLLPMDTEIDVFSPLWPPGHTVAAVLHEKRTLQFRILPACFDGEVVYGILKVRQVMTGTADLLVTLLFY